MARKESINIDLGAWAAQAAEQFRELNPRQPGQWPLLPRLAAFAATTLATVVVGWFLVLSAVNAELDDLRQREQLLRADYRLKLGQAANLGELRNQKIQVQEYVNQLEKQLPGKAEMDALLSDINQAGLGRGLQFELFRPGQVAVKDYYAELPISIRVSGRYHDIGSFAADVANLSRIVTLHDLNISTGPAGGGAAPGLAGGALNMDAMARTYRYLDPEEVETQRSARAKAKKAKS
jgi:type IV pilus assembly protein PilO